MPIDVRHPSTISITQASPIYITHHSSPIIRHAPFVCLTSTHYHTTRRTRTHTHAHTQQNAVSTYPAGLHSPRSSTTKMSGTFLNNTTVPIDIFWLDFGGNEKRYCSELGPGREYQQNTFVGHPWIARNSVSKRLLLVNGKNQRCFLQRPDDDDSVPSKSIAAAAAAAVAVTSANTASTSAIMSSSADRSLSS